MEKISYSLTLQVLGGPQIPVAGTVEVDGYEKFDLSVPAKAANNNGTATVSVAPGALDKVKVLVITAGKYDKSVDFKASGAAAAIALDGPITLLGGAASALLGSPPDSIVFTNSAAAPASVQILVGRKAVS